MGLTVEAFDPDESLAITQAILNDAEQMLDKLSMRAREDALVQSTRELKIAEDRVAKLDLAQTDLRNREGLLDAEKSNEANLKLVSELRGARINLAVQLSIGQRDLGPESRRIIDIKQQIKDLDDNIARIERQATGQDPNQKRQLASALTRFEALEHERKEAVKYAEEVRKAYDRARILVARQPQFFNMITAPVKADSATEPRRVLMISLVAAGSAVLFAAAMFARKTMAS
jgi:capsular polysaccharide transport system permease protein